MTGWFALVLIVAVVIATAAIFRAGRKAGTATEAAKARKAENETLKEITDVQQGMLDAAAHRPRDRDALVGRLRDGTF